MTNIETVMVDTCTFSDLSKPESPLGKIYTKHIQGRRVAISFVTLGEIYAGLPKLGPKRVADILQRLSLVVKLPFNDGVCRAYADMCALKTEDGTARTLEQNDKWIAACAKAYKIPIVSHNRKHFANIPGVTLINEEYLPLLEKSESTGPPPPF